MSISRNGALSHRLKLFKLDKHLHSLLAMKFYSEHPLQVARLIHCQKWPVDGATDLIV